MGKHEFTAVQAIRDALPTSRHARTLFDMVSARLGSEAVLETAGEATIRTLYRRDGMQQANIVPWPLLKLSTRGRMSTVVPLAGHATVDGDAWRPQPETVGADANSGSGEITLCDGPHSITVTYGKDGRSFETSRSESPGAHAEVVEALASTTASALELLAAYVTALDVGRHGPGRVLRPVPIPTGVGGAWNVGLQSVRAALFDGHVPDDAAWVVVDGFAGHALVWGDSLGTALASWRRMLGREQPRPNSVADADAPQDQVKPYLKPLDGPPDAIGFEMRIVGPKADVDWPPFVPDNTPAVAIKLSACPHEPEPGWTWRRLLTRHGQTVHALVKTRPEGCVLIGEDLAKSAVVTIASIEDQMDAADRATISALPMRPDLKSQTVDYCFVDERTYEPVTPRIAGGRASRFFDARGLDGGRLRCRAFRQRWV